MQGHEEPTSEEDSHETHSHTEERERQREREREKERKRSTAVGLFCNPKNIHWCDLLTVHLDVVYKL